MLHSVISFIFLLSLTPTYPASTLAKLLSSYIYTSLAPKKLGAVFTCTYLILLRRLRRPEQHLHTLLRCRRSIYIHPYVISCICSSLSLQLTFSISPSFHHLNFYIAFHLISTSFSFLYSLFCVYSRVVVCRPMLH